MSNILQSLGNQASTAQNYSNLISTLEFLKQNNAQNLQHISDAFQKSEERKLKAQELQNQKNAQIAQEWNQNEMGKRYAYMDKGLKAHEVEERLAKDRDAYFKERGMGETEYKSLSDYVHSGVKTAWEGVKKTFKQSPEGAGRESAQGVQEQPNTTQNISQAFSAQKERGTAIQSIQNNDQDSPSMASLYTKN